MNKTQVQNGPLRGASETAVPRQAPTDPLLLEQLRREIRVRHYSIRTEHAYTEWTERFLRHYEGRRPQDMGAVEINRYLSFLATDCNVAASTQNQALSALLFLYTHVLSAGPQCVTSPADRLRPESTVLTAPRPATEPTQAQAAKSLSGNPSSAGLTELLPLAGRQPPPQEKTDAQRPAAMKVWTVEQIRARFSNAQVEAETRQRKSGLAAWKNRILQLLRPILPFFCSAGVHATAETPNAKPKV